jgi:hypothetical protein
VVQVLQAKKIPASDVETFARSMGDKEVSVVLRSLSTVRLLTLTDDCITVNNKSLRIVASGKQIVLVRVHWLPVYASNLMVEALMKPYGKVLDVRNGNVDVGQGHFKSGVRLVKLEVNEVERNKIPHLMKFQCGSRALLTIQGRPPLCLKCFCVGHYRNTCSGETHVDSSFYKIKKSLSEAEEKAKEAREKEEYERLKKTVTEHENSDETRMNSDEQDKSRDEQEEQDGHEEHNSEDGNSDMSDDQEESRDDEKNENRGKKRDKEDDDSEVISSFNILFPPQKTRKSAVESPNRYAVLAEEDPILVIDESSSQSGSSGASVGGVLNLD